MSEQIKKIFRLLVVLLVGTFFILGSALESGLVVNIGGDSQRTVVNGESIIFDGSGSTAEAGYSIEEYRWSEGDIVYCANSSICEIDGLSEGVHTITFRITDSAGRRSSDSFKVTVQSEPNNAPTATAQTISMSEDSSRNISLSGTDVDGDTLTYTVTIAPVHGTFATGVYTPTANYFGSDSFSFTANDGSLTSAPATISLTITDVAEPNNAPIATAQSVSMSEDTTKSIILSGMDADGDTLTYSVTTAPSHGIFATGVYTPTANYFGSDSFSFTANDGSLTSAPVTVSITITDVAEPNNTPVAIPQNITMDEDTTKTITLSGTDVDGDVLTYTVTTAPTHGTFEGTTYTPDANYNGSDSFSFTANDGLLTSAPATISITINSINDAPTVDAGVDATITAGDSYTPSPTLSDSDGTIDSTVWKEGSTTLTFPKTDFSVGTHSLTVTVTDNEGATATDTLTLTLTCKSLLKTGQTTIYHNNDDGAYQKGTTRSYTRDAVKEVVTDTVTGLMWQDNESIQKKWVTQAHYDAGNYSDTSGDTATTYCESLALGTFTDWRLPSIEELVYLTDKGRRNPAIDLIFENTASSHYWSSTTVEGYSFSCVGCLLLRCYGFDYWYYKHYAFYVRCVRGGQ